MPSANMPTRSAMAIIAFIHSFNLSPVNLIITPRIIATPINIIDIEPADALANNCSSATPSPRPFALKVPATISVNAAITRSVNSQQKIIKSFRPILPMYFSTIIPIDLPSFLTEA